MHDAALIKAYREFRRELRRDIAWTKDLISLDRRLPGGSTKSPEVYFFRLSAEDYVGNLRGAVNHWRFAIARLSAWTTVLATRPDLEKLYLRTEFVGPLAEATLNRPYALSQRLIFVAHRLLEFAKPARAQGLLPDEKINFKSLHALTGADGTWAKFYAAIEQLNSPDTESRTLRYRRRLHHGIPPGLELGVMMSMTRQLRNGCLSIGIGQTEPLPLQAVLHPLLTEHQTAVRALRALYPRIREMHRELVKRERPTRRRG